jgi:hypothetical protein
MDWDGRYGYGSVKPLRACLISLVCPAVDLKLSEDVPLPCRELSVDPKEYSPTDRRGIRTPLEAVEHA